jgi:ribosomal protein S6
VNTRYCVVYGEACESGPRAQRMVENAATTIRNNRGMLERVEESFRRRFHYCIDNNSGHFEHFV